MQDDAKSPHLTREVLRGHQKRRPFRRREIEAMALGIVQPHPGSRGDRLRFCNRTHKRTVSEIATPCKEKPTKVDKYREEMRSFETELAILLQTAASLRWTF